MSTEPLQWEEGLARGSSKARRYADVDIYTYTVELYDFGDGEPKWRATFGKFLPIEDLYLGASEAEAMAAVEAHHAARYRRLAWERYMAENDPPEVGV